MGVDTLPPTSGHWAKPGHHPRQPRGPRRGDEGLIESTLDVVGDVRPKAFFFWLTMVILFLLVFVPIWNSLGLWCDPIFTYFDGAVYAALMLICCVVYLVLAFVVLAVFAKRARPEEKSEHSLLLLCSIFLVVLGSMLILVATPLDQHAATMVDELLNNCEKGRYSSQLLRASKELLALRQQPSCASQSSIVQCSHFETYDLKREAEVLEAAEFSLQCAGFCSVPPTPGANVSFPPTLFSRGNYQVACAGMMARRTRNFAKQISFQTMCQGCMLAFVSIFISLGKLLGFCCHRGSERPPGRASSYGATL